MIVICTCGQKNRLKAELATGATKAKEINCGACKTPLAEMAKVQVDRNADIVLAIVELYMTKKGSGAFDTHQEIADIFKKNGMLLSPEIVDVDEDEDEDEDESEDEDEPVRPKKKAKKPVAKKKMTH